MNGNIPPKHGGNLYAALRQSGGCFSEIIDFSANINPLGLSENIRETLSASLDSVIHYPDTQGYNLKQAISQHYQVNADEVTLGNGAVELMYIICHMLKPKRVLVTAPTFSEYESAARASGGRIEYCSLNAENNFAIDLQVIAQQLATVDMAFICNPNNPTGNLLSSKDLEELLLIAKELNTYIVIDESFMDFLTNDDHYTCRPLLAKYDHLIILHSLTKFYAIPGLRLGFSLANPKLTKLLHSGKDPWNVNVLAQNAGVTALQDHEYQLKSKEYIQQQNRALFHNLQTIPGLKPYVPSVNFILVNITATNMTGLELSQALAFNNILIRNCSNYNGLSAQFIRVAVKKQEENNILVNTLQKIIGEVE